MRSKFTVLWCVAMYRFLKGVDAFVWHVIMVCVKHSLSFSVLYSVAACCGCLSVKRVMHAYGA